MHQEGLQGGYVLPLRSGGGGNLPVHGEDVGVLRPAQGEVEDGAPAQPPDGGCVICYEEVENGFELKKLRSPCCDRRLRRICVQQFVMSSGETFQVPRL